MNLANIVLKLSLRQEGIHTTKNGGEDYEICELQITYDNEENSEFSVELLLDDRKFISLQEQDLKIRELLDKTKSGMHNEFYIVRNDVLFKHIVDNGHKFEARVIPNPHY